MVFGRGDTASTRGRREHGARVPGSRARARHRSGQAPFRIAATSAAAIAGIALAVGCGSGSNDAGSVVADRSDPANAEQAPTSVATDAAVPGPDAKLTTTYVPPGWTFVGEERPPTARGNTVILHVLESELVEAPNPGGPMGRLRLTVNAAHVPGMAASGRTADLAALVTQVMPGAGWRQETSLEVTGREAVEMSRATAPGEQRMIFSTMGDWQIAVFGGTGVTPDVVRQVAEGVQLG